MVAGRLDDPLGQLGEEVEVVGQLEAVEAATSPAAARCGRRPRRPGSDRDRCDSSSRGRRACPGRAARSGSAGRRAAPRPGRARRSACASGGYCRPAICARIVSARSLRAARRLAGSCPCRECRGRRCAAVPCPGSCAGSDRGRRRPGTARSARCAARRRCAAG